MPDDTAAARPAGGRAYVHASLRQRSCQIIMTCRVMSCHVFVMSCHVVQPASERASERAHHFSGPPHREISHLFRRPISQKICIHAHGVKCCHPIQQNASTRGTKMSGPALLQVCDWPDSILWPLRSALPQPHGMRSHGAENQVIAGQPASQPAQIRSDLSRSCSVRVKI